MSNISKLNTGYKGHCNSCPHPLLGFAAAIGAVYKSGGGDYAAEVCHDFGLSYEDFIEAGVDDESDLEALQKIYNIKEPKQ